MPLSKPVFGRIPPFYILFIMLTIIILWTGYLTADIQYNRQLNKQNQGTIIDLANKTGKIVNETAVLIEKQGNLSSAQRGVLLQEFAAVANHGGFSTKDVQVNNSKLLANNSKLLSNSSQTIAALNNKIDKLLSLNPDLNNNNKTK